MIYSCPYCSKKFKREANLKMHLLTHKETDLIPKPIIEPVSKLDIEDVTYRISVLEDKMDKTINYMNQIINNPQTLRYSHSPPEFDIIDQYLKRIAFVKMLQSLTPETKVTSVIDQVESLERLKDVLAEKSSSNIEDAMLMQVVKAISESKLKSKSEIPKSLQQLPFNLPQPQLQNPKPLDFTNVENKPINDEEALKMDLNYLISKLKPEIIVGLKLLTKAKFKKEISKYLLLDDKEIEELYSIIKGSNSKV